MNTVFNRLRGIKASDIFLSYYQPLNRANEQVSRRTIILETVIGNVIFWRAVFTECLAVFLFVFLAAGSSVAWPGTNASSNLHISISFGLVIASLVYCFGDVSGAHLNPAVTLPLMVYREISVVRGLLYIFAQCFGAYLGAALLRAVTPENDRYENSLGCTLLGENVSPGQGFVVELMATLQLVFTVFSVTDPRRHDKRIPSSLAIGVSVAIGLLFAIPFTGASMNPARSFGPALSAGNWSNQWLYWIAPLLAGLISSTIYRRLFAPGTLVHHQADKIKRDNAFQDAGSSESVIGERLALLTPSVTNNSFSSHASQSHIVTDV